MSERIYAAVGSNMPPVDLPGPDAAVARLRRGAGPSAPRSQPLNFEQGHRELLQLGKVSEHLLPQRGDVYPAHWTAVALPAPGSAPVDIAAHSSRVAFKMNRYLEEMLHPDGEELVRESPIKNYVDPHFR